MIKIREIKVIPKSVIRRFSDHARQEFEEAGEYAHEIVRKSDRAWLITVRGKPVLVAGVVRKSLIGTPPELWVLLCKDFCASLKESVKITRFLREELFKLYPKVRVKVPIAYDAGHRFAKFFGFTPTELLQAGVKDFTIYEASNGI